MWPQTRHLGVDSRRLPVHVRVAVCEPVLDAYAERGDRIDSRVGLLGDHRLRTGADARPHWIDLGSVLRVRVRHGWAGCRCPRTAGRRDEHRVRLPRLRISAADWLVDGLSAE